MGLDEGFFTIEGPGIVVTLDGLAFDGGDTTPALKLTQGKLVLRNVLSQNTRSGLSGGAIHVAADPDNVLEIEDSVLLSGNTSGEGGLVAILGGAATLLRSTLSGGESAKYGGLVSFAGTTLLIEDSLLEAGETSERGGGGAIYNEGPSLIAEDSWFIANLSEAPEGGGAIYHRNNTASYLRTVFCRNSALKGALSACTMAA